MMNVSSRGLCVQTVVMSVVDVVNSGVGVRGIMKCIGNGYVCIYRELRLDAES
jgi:hypothetical protein